MAAGLGVAQQDEDEEEQQSLTTAQGLGIAPTVNPATPAAASLPAPTAEPEEGGGLGQLLTGIANKRAANQGRLTPRQARQQQALEAENVQVQRGKMFVDLVNSTLDRTDKMDPVAAENYVNMVSDQFKTVVPNFKEHIAAIKSQPQAKAAFKGFQYAGPEILALYPEAGQGNTRRFMADLADPNKGKPLQDLMDRRQISMGDLDEKMAHLKEQLPSLPPEAQALAADGLSVFDVTRIGQYINDKKMRFDEYDLGTLTRNQEYASSIGLKTPEMIKKELGVTPSIQEDTVGGRRVRKGIHPQTGEVLWQQDAGEAASTSEIIDINTGTVMRGKAADLALAQEAKNTEDLRKKEVTMRQFVAGVQDQMRILETPGVSTTANDVVNLVGSLAANVDQAMALAGVDKSGLTVKNPITGAMLDADKTLNSQLEATFPELRGKTAAYKSQMYNLAYMKAKGWDASGKLSDNDLKIAMKSIGSADDPEQVKGALRQSAKELVRNYKIEHKSITGKDFTEFDALMEDGGNKYKAMTDAEFGAVDLNSLDVDGLREYVKEEKRRSGGKSGGK